MNILGDSKICSSCKESKRLIYFGVDNSRKDKKSIYCIICRNDKGRLNRRKYIKKTGRNKVYARNWELQTEYGIDTTRYNEILDMQNHQCAICNSPPTNRNLDVDHCHESGKVRGLLCKRCNTGLGCFKDNLHLLKLAVNYIETNNDFRLF